MNDTNMNEVKIDGTNHAENVSINEQEVNEKISSEEISSEEVSRNKPSDLVVGTAWFISFLLFMTAWMYFTA